MTSKLTRERIELIANFHRAMTLPPSHDEIEELARMALAAMDSEPDCNERKLFCSTDTARMRKVVSASDGSGTTPLYHRAAMLHAGNSPAIPEGYVMVPKEPTPEILATITEAIRAMRGSAATYARVLAAAPQPQSAPQNIPEIIPVWIPVSEHMPEVGVKVLCFPVKDEPIHATFNGQLWLQDVSWSGSEEPIDNVIPVSVTHWMPLPAAPQEPKP